MAHLHDVFDDDPIYEIDTNTREILYAGAQEPILIQGDHNSERFTFKMKRFVDGHDVMLCNTVRVHFINISTDNPLENNPGLYEVDDLESPLDDKTSVTFTWLLSKDAAMFVGTLSFLVEFLCKDDDNIVSYSWHTGMYTGCVISKGMDNTEAIIGRYYDTLDQWITSINTAGNETTKEALNRIDVAAKIAEDTFESTIAARVEEVKNDITLHGLTNAVNGLITHELGVDTEKVISQSGIKQIYDDLDSKHTEMLTELSSELAGFKQSVLAEMDNLRHFSEVTTYPLDDDRWNIVNAADMVLDKVYVVCTDDFNLGVKIEVSEVRTGSKTVYRYIVPLDETTHELTQVYNVIRFIGVEYDYFNDEVLFKTGYYPRFSYEINGNVYEYKCDDELIQGSPTNDSSHSVTLHPMLLSNVDEIRVYQSPFASNTTIPQPSNGIREIAGPISSDLEHTYTIVLDNGYTKEFVVKDGVGIQSFDVYEHGAYTDTYKVLLTDGEDVYFDVPNSNSVGIVVSDSGALIHAEDLIPLTHRVKVKVRSKNMIPYPYPYSYGLVNGVTFTNNNDGSISATGTVNDETFANVMVCEVLKLEAGKTYYVGNSENLLFAYKDESGTTRYLKNGTIVWKDTYEFIQLYIQYSPNVVVDDTIYPIFCESDVPVDYVPHIDPANVILYRCAKNLIRYPYAMGTEIIQDVIYTDNDDGTVTVNGTAANDNSIYYLTHSEDTTLHLSPGTYTLSGCPSGGSYDTYCITVKTDDEVPVYYHDTGNGCTFTLNTEKTVYIYICVTKGASVDSLAFKPQLEVGDITSDYEKYRGASYPLASDGVPPRRVTSLSPIMNLLTDTPGAIIDATYNLDQTAAYNKINTLLNTLLNGGA